MRVTVIIPAYNESPTIGRLVQRVLDEPTPKEVLVVDDGSTDGTPDAIAEHVDSNAVSLLRHERNRGKGAAIRTALSHATGEIVLIQDADLEYDPQDYGRLLAPIRAQQADVVIGTRFVGGEAHRVLYFWHAVANRALTTLSNAVTNLNLTDMECCLKAFRREVLESFDLKENGFGVEPELVARVARGKWRVFEVGVSYAGRTYAEGKKITWRSGVRALYCIARYGLFR